jgi:glycosyltransferase involved in cell wall biosynthesis
MRIAFDATALPRRLGGAGNYVAKLVASLRELDKGDRLFVFCKPEDVERLGPWPSAAAEPVSVPLRNRAHRLAWEQLGLASQLKRIDADLLHSPHYTIPLARVRAARVVTFHDMIFLLYPEHHQRAKVLFFTRMIRAAARIADHIVADSDATRTDAIRLLGVQDSRITTVPLAADPSFVRVTDPVAIDQVCARYRLVRPFVLTVSTLEPRKNLAGAVGAVATVRRRGCQCQLAIAGASGWKYSSIEREIAASEMGEHVNMLGFVDDRDLPALYSAASVFVYPSFYEGFGIPPLEAMACGAAVVASNRSSIPEVVGDGGILCDPGNVEALADAILSLLRDSTARQQLQARALQRARQFSWSRTAARTYDVYQALYAQRSTTR